MDTYLIFGSQTFGFAKDKKKKAALLLIYTAANRGKAECGRTTFLTDTAAIEKRQSCGRAPRLAASSSLLAARSEL